MRGARTVPVRSTDVDEQSHQFIKPLSSSYRCEPGRLALRLQVNSRLFSILAALLLIGSLHAENLSPVRLNALTCEHLQNPIGIGAQQPRLAWKLSSDRMGEVQTVYQIRAATSAAGIQPDEAPPPGLLPIGNAANRELRGHCSNGSLSGIAG